MLGGNDKVQPEGGVLRDYSTGIHFIILGASVDLGKDLESRKNRSKNCLSDKSK